MFEYLDHPSDICVQLSGKTYEEFFREALSALLDQAGPPPEDGKRTKKTIIINSNSAEGLLVEYLNEFIFLLYTKRFFPVELEFLRIEEQSLECIVRGIRFSMKDFHPAREIKAATYHELKIVHNGAYRARVVLDV